MKLSWNPLRAGVAFALTLMIASPVAIAGGDLATDAGLDPSRFDSYAACFAEISTLYKAGSASGQQNDLCYTYTPYRVGPSDMVLTSGHLGGNRNVWIDEAHNNFHKKDGRYAPFTRLLTKEGYNVQSFADSQGFTAANLAALGANSVLVIANAVHVSNTPEANWMAPIESAFTEAEIAALLNWVQGGGSLMLIADHFPFPGAARQLGRALGFYMDDGYSFDPSYNEVFLYDLLESDLAKKIMRREYVLGDISPTPSNVPCMSNGQPVIPRTIRCDLVDKVRDVMVGLGADVNSMQFWAGTAPTAQQGFSYGDGQLVDHPITRGLATDTNGQIPFVTSFTGQSFRYRGPTTAGTKGQTDYVNYQPLMILGQDTYTLLTTSQDAYFGIDRDASENALVTSALTNSTVPPNTVDKRLTNGDLQAAVLEYGNGKIAVFGEAGMFTAQIAANGTAQMGFNNPIATTNQQFVINTIRWLDNSLTTGNQSADAPANTGLSADLLPSALLATAKAGETELRLAKTKENTIYNVRSIDELNNQVSLYLSGRPNTLVTSQSVVNESTLATDAQKEYIDSAGYKTPGQQYIDNYDGAGGGGGCSITQRPSPVDPTLPILVFAAGGYLWRNRRRAQ